MSGLVALNDMDVSDGPAFECWPGSHQDEIFVELQKTEGEVQRVFFFSGCASEWFPTYGVLTESPFCIFVRCCFRFMALRSAVVQWHPLGLCDSPNGSFRVLQDAGRGWLQGKGMKRQRVPISAWPAHLDLESHVSCSI